MTPEILAQVISAAEFAERYPAYREAREHAAGIRAMIAENASLRADKARLDWLEGAGKGLISPLWAQDYIHIRTAIDAARASQP